MLVSSIRQVTMSDSCNKTHNCLFFQCATRCVVQPKSGSTDKRAHSPFAPPCAAIAVACSFPVWIADDPRAESAPARLNRNDGRAGAGGWGRFSCVQMIQPWQVTSSRSWLVYSNLRHVANKTRDEFLPQDNQPIDLANHLYVAIFQILNNYWQRARNIITSPSCCSMIQS